MSVATGSILEIGIPAEGETAEAVAELFDRHGGGAVIEIDLAPGGARQTWVRTYVPAADDEARLRLELGLLQLAESHPIPEPVIRRLAEANWAEAWKAHFAPLRVDGGFLIVPAWIDPAEAGAGAGDHVIRIDPGMAFGTGQHASTQLCLTALAAALRPGDAVLDLGTGSGILAIGAARLGAGRVKGIDIDAKALEIAAANAALNGVEIELSDEPLEAVTGGPFDLVLANLLAGLLVDLAPLLVAALRPGACLIASGILLDQAEAVSVALAAAGLEGIERRAAGDWVALLGRRREGQARA